MSAFFTIGTTAQASISDTARLLFEHAAIWTPPMAIQACGAVPHPGDRFWLLYREEERLRLLGGGPIARAPRVGSSGYTVLWTDADRPGVRDAARAFQYGGPDNMAFLRLDPPRLFGLEYAPLIVLPGDWRTSLNLATAAQETILQAVLPF